MPRLTALLCPHCEQEITIHLPDESAARDARCSACEKPVELDWSKLTESGGLARCMLCNNKEIYRQRDFNRRIGCAVVLVAIIFARPPYYISLWVGAAIDALLYVWLPQVLVCYKCRSVFRGFEIGDHKTYELERAAKYDQYVG